MGFDFRFHHSKRVRALWWGCPSPYPKGFKTIDYASCLLYRESGLNPITSEAIYHMILPFKYHGVDPVFIQTLSGLFLCEDKKVFFGEFSHHFFVLHVFQVQQLMY